MSLGVKRRGRCSVLINGPLPPPIGGMETYCAEYMRSPLPSKCDVTMCRAILIKRVFSTNGLALLWWRTLNSIFITVVWICMLAVKRPDIAHIHTNSWAGFYVKAMMAILARMIGTKSVLHIHGAEFRLFHKATPPVLRWVIPFLINRNSTVFVLSKEWHAYFASIGVRANRLTVMTNCVFLPELSTELRTAPPENILFMSRFEKRKGVHELASAIERCGDRLRRCRFVLAGPETYEWDAIAGRLAQARADGLVELPGSVEGQKKDRCYRDADIYLLQSYDEGMPIGLLEAMSYGLACITTPVGGIPDVIKDGENGLLVPPGDVDALCEALESLVGDPQRCRRLGRCARDTIDKRYNWKTRATDIMDIYKRLLS